MDVGLVNQPELHKFEPIGITIGSLAGGALEGMFAVARNDG